MTAPAPRRRLGWIGIAVVALGVAVSAVGVWYVIRAKPRAGPVIEELRIDDGAKIVVRAEDGGDRAFVELHVDGAVKWQALVPPYAGRKGAPGISWSEVAVGARVIRDGKAEVFALATRDGSKLGGVHLGKDHGPVKRDAPGPVTLTDHVRSYELVAGDGWNQLVAIDLRMGTALWVKELGPTPVTDGGVEGGQVWIQQGTKRWFGVFNGKEDRRIEKVGMPPVFPWKPGDPLPDPEQPPKPL